MREKLGFITAVCLLALILCLGIVHLEDGSSSRAKPPSTLRFVAVISRHGSRSPVNTYPKDPYPYTDKRYWPKGKGQLTNYGKRQMLEVGRVLRLRYNGFLPSSYQPNDVIAMYNTNERDLESLSSLLAGLYHWPAEEARTQSIPLQPKEFDICELAHNFKCPSFMVEAFKMAALYAFKMALNTTSLLRYVSKHSGELMLSVFQLSSVIDPLIMQKENGLKIPEWTEPVFSQMSDIYAGLLHALFAGNKQILSLTGGRELADLSSLLTRAANGSLLNGSKLYVELAHDCTLFSLLGAMHSPYALLPINTSAHLVFELHQVADYTVKVFYYRNYLDNNPVEVSVKGCPSPCSLQGFNEFVRSVVLYKNWKKSCNHITLF